MKKTLILACLSAQLCIKAQTPVTAVFTHFANATTATSYTGGAATGTVTSAEAGNSFTYHFGTNVATTNNNQYLDSFTALSMNYHLQAAHEVVYFRHVNNASATGLRKSLWFQSNTGSTIGTGGTAPLLPDYDDSLERLFTKQIFNIGIDNNFENSTNTNNGNIERVDVLFPYGVSATDGTRVGFAVFDRGNSGSHDPFYIAAVKTLDASGNPSAYYNAVPVTAAEYGSNVGGAVNFIVLRENPGDGHLLMMNNTTSQNRDGVLIRFADLGVANNSIIYGYSLFGTDVTVSPAANMVNYANAANFPTGSDYPNGGLDQVAVTGVWVTSASYVVLAEKVDSFCAVSTGNGSVRLSWDLGVTDDLQQVIVERSGNGTDFSPLVDLADPRSGPRTLLDAKPLSGLNVYRLKLVNVTGEVNYSAICSVTTGSPASFGLQIYPNPVHNGQLLLGTQGIGPGAFAVRILDLSGNLISQQRLTGLPSPCISISLPSRVSAGMYVLQLTDKSGEAVSAGSFVVD